MQASNGDKARCSADKVGNLNVSSFSIILINVIVLTCSIIMLINIDSALREYDCVGRENYRYSVYVCSRLNEERAIH